MYLLIVTGLSGAGKSLALHSLEEEGYYTVDNLPSPMLPEFCRLCREAVPAIKRAAVAIDSRESLLSRSSASMTEILDNLTEHHEILFLDARDDVLKKRYNEVRRRHPLGDAGDAGTGVRRERVYLQGMRDRANYILDTSDVLPRNFSRLISKVLPEYESQEPSVLLCSFGYKRGVPVDADVVLDMRFTPNPFYIQELRDLSGLDAPVRDYVLSQPYVDGFISAWERMILSMLPLYEEQGKHILRICFGCTGGRHRSVTAAEEMARRLIKKGLTVRVYHRDLTVEADDITRRFKDG